MLNSFVRNKKRPILYPGSVGIILCCISELILADITSLGDNSTSPHQPKFVLPTIMLGTESEQKRLPFTQILIKKIDIIGNTVLPDSTLTAIAQSYLNKRLLFSAIQKLRDELTSAYVNQGYVTSGVILPNQTIRNHTIVFHVIEGIRSRTVVETDGRFREETIIEKLGLSEGSIVNTIALEQQLQLLQRDHRIHQVKAELIPGSQFGESELTVSLEEAIPYRVSVGANNLRSPTIGAEGIHLNLYHGNVTGVGDEVFLGLNVSEGLEEINAQYEFPLFRPGFSVNTHIDWAESDIIDNNFDDLDIKSEAQTYGITLKQTLVQSPSKQIGLFLTGEYLRTKSFLLGSGFSFSAGPERGVSKVAAVRLGLDMTFGGTDHVLSLRTSLSQGLDIAGATKNSGNTPDGQFLKILGQVQWVHNLTFMKSQFIARTEFQFSDSPLLGIEKFSVGGYSSVRGYRENLLVRDNGVVASIEHRLPVWRSESNASHLTFASFVDVGYSRDKRDTTTGSERLLSAGIGLLGTYAKNFTYQVYWGHAFKDIDTFQESNLQDDGFHFTTQLTWP